MKTINNKGQFWNLWMLVAFIIVIMLFIWYSFSAASKVDSMNSGQQSAQIFSLYQEKERITILLDQIVDQSLRDGVNELANNLPGNCGISQTGKPIVQDGRNCINTEMMDAYMNIVKNKVNELIKDYPGTLLSNFTLIIDSSLGNSIIVYSEKDVLIQPPLEVIIRERDNHGFPTMIARISTVRPIPDSFYELVELAEGINNPSLKEVEYPEMSLAIQDALSNPNPYCESDSFAHQKFLGDIKTIIDKCPFVNDNPCLCGSVMPPGAVSANGLFYEDDNIIRVRERTEPRNPGSIIASSSQIDKEIMHFFPSPNEAEKLLSYSLMNENELYYYAFPRNNNVNVETQGEYSVNLEAKPEGIILASANHLTVSGKNIPFCSNLPEFSNYKVNIFVWDTNQVLLEDLKRDQGSRSGFFDLYAVSPQLNKETYVHSNLIDPPRLQSRWNGKAVNIFLLPAPTSQNRLRIGASNHFSGLPSYINGFIRMDESVFYAPQTLDNSCYDYCIFLGGTESECNSVCTDDCPVISGTPKILDSSLSYGTSAENPASMGNLYENAFRTLTNADYPYLVIYYPTEITLSCSTETLDTSSRTPEIDTESFVTSILNSVMLGMNAYFSAPIPSNDVCIDYPIKELLHNPIEETYKIEDIYTHVAVPKETDNIWPIELERVTQCYGPIPVGSTLNYAGKIHRGIDLQPPRDTRIGWGQGLSDHFPEGKVVASFDGVVVEIGRCIVYSDDDLCPEIEYTVLNEATQRMQYDGRVPPKVRNGYGEYVIVRNPNNGLYAVYAHFKPGSLEEAELGWQPCNIGDTTTPLDEIMTCVYKGQELGIVGNTGYSGGAHLHFEIYSRTVSGAKETYNPLCFLPKEVNDFGTDVTTFFPDDGTSLDKEEFLSSDDEIEEVNVGLYHPPGDSFNCYTNYYAAYHNADLSHRTGISNMCPSFT